MMRLEAHLIQAGLQSSLPNFPGSQAHMRQTPAWCALKFDCRVQPRLNPYFLYHPGIDVGLNFQYLALLGMYCHLCKK